MPTKDQEKETLAQDFAQNEAGVADLMAFYERVEEVYQRASASIQETPDSYVSDSTDVSRLNAYLG